MNWIGGSILLIIIHIAIIGTGKKRECITKSYSE